MAHCLQTHLLCISYFLHITTMMIEISQLESCTLTNESLKDAFNVVLRGSWFLIIRARPRSIDWASFRGYFLLVVSRWYQANHRKPFPAGVMSGSLAGKDTGAAGIKEDKERSYPGNILLIFLFTILQLNVFEGERSKTLRWT